MRRHVRGICDRCGFERPLVTLKKEWTGLKVCPECFDRRHPQDLVRGVRDNQAIRDARPDPDPVYLDTNDVTPESL